MSADNNPEASQAPKYGLRAAESEQLVFVKSHLDAVFSGVLSTIAAERLGYRVTSNTQFRLSPDFKSVEIWERAAEPAPENQGNEASPIRQA
jgi:hypothetical protein